MGSGGCLVRDRFLALREVWGKLQCGTTRRTRANATEGISAAVDDNGDSGTGAASRVFGASVRDGGMEFGNGVGGMLGIDSVCDRYGFGHDSDGGSGVGEKIWEGVCGVSRAGSGALAAGRRRG